MPTYTVTSAAGTVPHDHRAEIAEFITQLHHEATGAPRYLVQVIFNDLSEGTIFLAGRPLEQGHVWVRGDIRSGRTEEQKTTLLEQATARIAGILGLEPAQVWVYLNEIPGANMTEYGNLLPEPGQEDQWFAALPRDLQERLRDLT